MVENRRKHVGGGWWSVVAVVAAVVVFAAPRAADASGTDNVAGWAWNEQAGWISMNGTNCERFGTNDPCELGGAYADISYGVTVDARGYVSGFAWSRNAGWLCFGATCSAYGGATPPGGWAARFNAITGQAAGWAKVLALGNDGWIALSCEQATPSSAGGTCASVSYRTIWRELDTPNGEWTGEAWNGPAVAGNHALGWVTWRPQNDVGVTTTWNPPWVCTVSGDACNVNNDECAVLGELCCRGGAPCGQCRGFTDA
ncbi:MAG: hypothetical protein Q7T01_01255, partial [bacterium]|nr:hypothetical protein [bacterium]